MNESRWDQIKRLFNTAMEKPAAERAAFLDHACGQDAELRREVQSLIQSARPTHTGPILTGGAADALANASTASLNATPLAEKAGSIIGPYKLLQIIGEGGFGTVFMAEQSTPVRRRVALKIIKLGMDTRQVIARFEAERQALALMDHPHIAKVLDGGVTPLTSEGTPEGEIRAGGGRPYFVMEYVTGDPITTFAIAHKLTIKDRLALFAQVCQAVQHAHHKGIIHRDIKPGNVLVSMTDGKPFAKVIDFGIAKATAQPLTEKTLFTEHRQLIGTPEYMSPEQAEGSADIDTRTDVYALGVLLYELLTGLTPFDGKRLRSAAYGEMQRIIKEEEPPMPSVRLSRAALGTPTFRVGSSASGGAGVTPVASSPQANAAQSAAPTAAQVKGELDWIVMKALDKDRARRYDTPNALAADVQRHLAGEAVVAAPPSAGYRLRKFVRRNKGAVSAVCAVVLALSAGLSVAAWQAKVANSAKQEVQAINTKLLKQRDAAQFGVDRMLSTITGGKTWSPIESFRFEDGRPGTDDPLGFAISIGQSVADSLKEEQERVRESAAQLARTVLSSKGYAGMRPANMMKTMIAGAQQDQDYGWVSRVTPTGVAELMWLDHNGNERPPTTSESLIAISSITGDVLYKYENTVESLKLQTDAAEWSAYTANLALAQSAIAANDYPEARRILARVPKGKVGWEGQFLALSALSVDWSAYADKCIGFSDDGSIIYIGVWGDAAGEVSLVTQALDLRTRTQVPALRDPSILVTDARLREDGSIQTEQRTASASTAKVWSGWPSDADWLSRAMGRSTWNSTQCFSRDGRYVAVCERSSSDNSYVLLMRSDQWGGPAWWADHFADVALVKAAILASSPNGPSGLTLITPDGSRVIKGLADGTVRFYEARDGKPTLPATADSPEGTFREIAVFRIWDWLQITDLQMTGDGTRLIISLADGSARVWDIRDPEERRKDLQAEWAERVPAGEYLDTLWSAPPDSPQWRPTPSLREAIIADASLTPLRRLVAVELLKERAQDANAEAYRAFAAMIKDQTDPAAVQAKAQAAELPPRVKELVVASANAWTYSPPVASETKK